MNLKNRGSHKLSAGLYDFSQIKENSPYSRFSTIDGTHAYQKAVPEGFVSYRVRTRQGGRVFFFNFSLAKEMGLIPKNHPEVLDDELKRVILHTFSLVIINEYDEEKKIQYADKDIRPNAYMATRYLQLQHPDKTGRTSGDGRGIWNGQVSHQGVSWDVSSSGTGATRLSPACAIEKRFFKTGDPRVCYGNGYGSLDDGLSTAILSEIFHRNGIETERVLAVIEFEDGVSINVRASQNLLRPSHFFGFLKQGNEQALKSVVEYYSAKQIGNGAWPKSLREKPLRERLNYLVSQAALSFSRATALFESNYIFVWLDWDGDNILCNGGIIDYGSVRQFGLFHHEYRYDDVDRFSTKITEQKAKARLIVQTFAQLKDYLLSGKKKPLTQFRDCPELRLFDKNYSKCMNEQLLKRMGFGATECEYLQTRHLQAVSRFKRHFQYFERSVSSRGIYTTVDGITADAIFSMRDLLRELPRQYLQQASEVKPIEAAAFVELMKSSYSKKKDLKLTKERMHRIGEFQRDYLALVARAAKNKEKTSNEKNVSATLSAILMRTSVINQADRITGNGVILLTDLWLEEFSLNQKSRCVRTSRKIDRDLYSVFSQLIVSQLLSPDDRQEIERRKEREILFKRAMKELIRKSFDLISRTKHDI